MQFDSDSLKRIIFFTSHGQSNLKETRIKLRRQEEPTPKKKNTVAAPENVAANQQGNQQPHASRRHKEKSKKLASTQKDHSDTM